MQNDYFVHALAVCDSDSIGRGTKIWPFVHILKGAVVGQDCNICESVFIENDVKIGDRVTIKNGVQLWDGLRVEDDVFIGPNVTFSNDKFPRSKRHQIVVSPTRVQNGASVGANATILPGISIGPSAMIGSGSVVTRDVPAFALVRGNPARIVGYVDETGLKQESRNTKISTLEASSGLFRMALLPGNTRLYQLPTFEDMRGSLTVSELGDVIDFPGVRRMFVVHSVPSSDIRGEHAHVECHQLLICTKGQVTVRIDDGMSREETLLDRPEWALHVPPMVWCSQYGFSSDASLVVLASHTYDDQDYIRDYDQFLRTKLD
jgi:acetyltransferase-like isoleucine patch superfamily enzyme/dTDP-4-dehydrorhamnose 3,5-epimerase-like enzyme